MSKNRFYSFILSWLIPTFCWCAATSMVLVIQPAPDDFVQGAKSGDFSHESIQDDSIILIGRIDLPDFMITDLSQIQMKDNSGDLYPLYIEEASIYSEFDEDEVNGLRLCAIIPEKELAEGPAYLQWGSEVNGNNTVLETLPIHANHKEKYRLFQLEPAPETEDSASYYATLEVIVDDHADSYYLWYLLPMALIFSLLMIKKFALKKESNKK